jgi:acetyltransferase-like isoleucine patch superfamily enzyme
MKSRISRLLFRIANRVKSRVEKWWNAHQMTKVYSIPNFRIHQEASIYGVPRVIIHPKAEITVEQGVVLNSRQEWCLLAAYAPVTLMANHPDARIHIGSQTRLHASCIRAYQSVTIGKRCLIASNCQITDASGHALSFQDVESRIRDICLDARPVFIADDVWLCEGVKVLPGVSIGKGTVVAAGSVVTKNLPAYCLAGGIPAKVIKSYDANPDGRDGRS